MGQFSWITKSGEQIRNEHHAGQKVWMVFKSNGITRIVKEEEYEGYGEFGGVDYFNALYEMNFEKIPNHQYIDNLDEQRSLGIDLNYNEIKYDGKLEYPQLFTHSPSQWEIDNIDWFTPCPDDPRQGWVNEYGWDIEDEDC